MLILVIGAFIYDVRSAVHQSKIDSQLVQAVRQGWDARVRQLLSEGASPNTYFDPGTYDLASPSLSWLERLRQFSRRAPSATSDRAPILSLAITYFRNDLATLLIERGADVNARDGKGSTPLHYAAEHKNQQILIELLTRHASVNTTNKAGNTALHLAVSAAIEDSPVQLASNVVLLLDHGADANIANTETMKPLDIAALKCIQLHRNWIDDSLQNLASKRRVDPDGITRNYQHQLDMRKPIVQLLRKHGATGSSETEDLVEKSLVLDNAEILELLKPDPQADVQKTNGQN